MWFKIKVLSHRQYCTLLHFSLAIKFSRNFRFKSADEMSSSNMNRAFLHFTVLLYSISCLWFSYCVLCQMKPSETALWDFPLLIEDNKKVQLEDGSWCVCVLARMFVRVCVRARVCMFLHLSSRSIKNGGWINERCLRPFKLSLSIQLTTETRLSGNIWTHTPPSPPTHTHSPPSCMYNRCAGSVPCGTAGLCSLHCDTAGFENI